MELSIIIVNYNAAAFIQLCLYSVCRAIENIDAQVIVVDNNSSDNSCSVIKKDFPWVQLVQNKENVGFSAANNIGVKAATGQYLCILNPDTIVGENVFVNVLAYAKKNTSTAFTTVQLIDGTGDFLPESKRQVPTPKIARQKLLGNNKNYYCNHLDKDHNGIIEVLVGAFMICRKEVYQELGGFDERYFMYGEDIDLSYSAILKGYHNYYIGSEKVIHFKGESTIKDKVYLDRFYGAMQLFYDKYFKQSNIQNLLVKIGVALLKSRPLPKNNPRTTVTHKILASKDLSLQVDGYQQAPYNQLSLSPTNSQILWDIKSIDTHQVIEFMSLNASKSYSYRFLLPNHDLIIGSDHASSRGEIVEL